MCKFIYLPAESREIYTVADLEAIIGDNPIQWDEEEVALAYAEGTFSKDCCLCGVNVVITLLDAGHKVWRDPGGDHMEFFCERVEHLSPSKE